MYAADNGAESQNYSDSDSDNVEEGGTNSSCILDDLRELEVICSNEYYNNVNLNFNFCLLL